MANALLPGIPADAAEKIFEPFYSTKEHGIGIGLAICRSIIASHGGRLWAANNNGSGALFHFTVPIHKEAKPWVPGHAKFSWWTMNQRC